MNKEVLLQNGIDYLEGVARFAGQAEIYEKFLKLDVFILEEIVNA